MITGIVNGNLQPVVRLLVGGPQGQEQEVDGIVDTGFNGFLTVPPALVSALRLASLARIRATLADGRQEFLDVCEATVLWDGLSRTVEADGIDAPTLIGMALLEGHDLCVRAVAGGSVTITAIP